MSRWLGIICGYTLLIMAAGEAARAGEFKIVTDGIAGSDAFFVGSDKKTDWRQEKNALVSAGPGKYIGCLYTFEPENLQVSATLSLDTLNGTAAGFVVGYNTFLFDTREHRFVLEGSDFPADTSSLLDTISISPNVPFRFDLSIRKGKVEFKIDGKVVGTFPWKNAEPVFLGLRPHRSTMRIINFHITGTSAGQRVQGSDYIGKRQTRPVITKVFNVDHDAEFAVYSRRKIESGQTRARLISLNNGSENSEFNILLTGNIINLSATIPSEVMRRAYEGVKTEFVLKPFRLVIGPTKDPIVDQTLILSDPQAACDYPRSEVRNVNGVPRWYTNGKSNGMMYGLLIRQAELPNFRGDNVSQYNEAGMTLFPMYVTPYLFMQPDGRFDRIGFQRDLEEYILRFISEAPNGRLLVRWRLWMPPGWCDVYPDQAIGLDNGMKILSNTPEGKLQPSYASPLWQKQSSAIMVEMLSAIRRTPFADRIAGIHLCHGNCGEWNHWGYQQKAFVDFSKPMQRAFSTWLKNKYQNRDHLRKAWANPDVDFTNDLVPSRAIRLEASSAILRKLPQGMPAADYYEFFSQYTVETIEHFAKIVKSVSDNRLLAGAFYGYYLGHLHNAPYHFQDSGHYATERYLASPWLDFICGPYPYAERLINAVPNGICGSIALHGKLWINENDQRTHRSGPSDIQYGTTANEGESIAVLRRDFMQNLSKNTNYYFYDFVRGWYSDPEYMRNVKRLREVDRFADSFNDDHSTQVAVFVNEAGIPFISNRYDSGLFRVFKMLIHEMDAAGAPWKIYLLSDLDKVDLSNIKLVIFPDAYALSGQDVDKIHKVVCNNNRRVVWLYAPGLLNLDTGKFDPDFSKHLTGIGIRYQPSFTNKGLFSEIPGFTNKLATETPLEMISIDDTKATILGCLSTDHLPGAALCNFGVWESIVVCFPDLNSAWLQALYAKAGVHIWKNEASSIFHAYGPFISLYTRKAGKSTLCFPRKVEIVYDLFENRIIGEDKTFITIDSPLEPRTIIYYAGEKAPLNSWLKAEKFNGQEKTLH